MRNFEIYFFVLLSLILYQACQKVEIEEQKVVADKWIPAFLKYDYKSFTDTEKLHFSYREGHQKDILGINKRVYPPYFGGMYFCRETGKDVILLTDTSDIIKNDLIKLCSLSLENIVFKSCKYSLNELLELQYKICDLKSVNPIEIGLSQKNNQVCVTLNKLYGNNEINLIKSILSDTDIIEFKFIENDESQVNKKSAAWNRRVIDDKILDNAPYPYVTSPGNEFFTALNGKISNRGSIGFVINEEINGIELRGFVTANHCVYSDAIYFKIKDGYAPFAYRIDKDLRMDVVACIILPQSCTLTSSIIPQLAMVKEGETLYVDGASSGNICGIMKDVSVFKDLGFGRFHFYKIEANVQEGDSGGPVYTSDGIIGMLIGRDPDYRHGYLVPTDLLLESLNLSLAK